MEISIPKPCHENYRNMLPTNEGRYCSACSKVVVDFTRMSDAEVIAYFEARKQEETCGRFKCGQAMNTSAVNNWLYKQRRIMAGTSRFSFKVIALASFTWLLSLTGCFMGARGRPERIEDKPTREAPAQTRPHTAQPANK